MAKGSKDDPIPLPGSQAVDVHVGASAFNAVAFQVEVFQPGEDSDWQQVLRMGDDPRVAMSVVDARLQPFPTGTQLRVTFLILGKEQVKYAVALEFRQNGTLLSKRAERGGKTNANGVAQQVIFARYL